MQKQRIKASSIAGIAIAVLAFCFSVVMAVYLTIDFFDSFPNERKYYSFEQIDKYVGDVFGEECVYIESPEENYYIYEDGNGVRFTVEATSNPLISFYSDHLPIYQKGVGDDYTESAISHYKEDIEKLAESNGLEAVVYTHDIYVIIEDASQAEKAAEVMAGIDNLLDIDIDYWHRNIRTEKSHYDPSETINLHLKPADADSDEYLRYDSESRICTYTVSISEWNRLTKEMVMKRLSRNRKLPETTT